MKIDTNQHIQQLKLLGYSDGEDIFYRSFPGKGIKDGFAKNNTRKYPNVPKTQSDNLGLYFVVNGGGHKDQDVKQCRAFFAEWDDRPLAEQETVWMDKVFLPPTFQVKTRKSIHCYWVLESPIPAEDWKIIQANLLNFLDADRSLKNPSRVLRVAGAWHVMDGKEPILCELVNETGIKYHLAQIEAAIILPEPEPQKINIPPAPKITGIETSIIPPIPLINCLPHRDRDLIANGAGEGSRNRTGYGLGKDLIATENYLKAEGISFSDSAYNLFLDYCRKCDPSDWGDREWEQVWKSAEKDAPAKPPLDPDKIDNCLRKWAKDNGQKVPLKPVLTSQPLSIPQPETARVYGGTKPLNAGELARFVEDNIAGRLSFDELRTEVLLDDQKIVLGNDLKFWFLKQFGELATKEDIYDCFTYYARQNSFNPLEQYLTSLNCQPVPITDLASRYFGRTEQIYDRMVEMWLISCVARGLTRLDDPNQNGTQVDHTLILQSGQGKYKSTWFKTLGGKWFSDSVKDIESKDSLMIVHSNWIIELSELDRITSKKQAGAIKHWLTQRCDSFRKPYAREIDPNLPRRCVFCGTVNPKTFLVDDENRRFWIVPIADSVEVLNIPLLERERDGIWLSAYNSYKSGAVWWPTEEEKAAIALLTNDFKEEDAWQEQIEPYLLDKSYISAFEVLVDCLKFDIHQIKRADEMRVNKILDGLGWNKTTRREQTDPLTGKKVFRRIRLAPTNFKNNQIGWKVGKSQSEQDFQSYQPTNEVGKVGKDTNGHLPTYQPHLPTSDHPQSLDSIGINQPTNQYHHFPDSGNEIPEPTEEQKATIILTINQSKQRLGWDKQRLQQEAKERYGKSSFEQLTGAEILDLDAFLAALPAQLRIEETPGGQA